MGAADPHGPLNAEGERAAGVIPARGLLFPSLYSGWFQTGDVLLVGPMRDITSQSTARAGIARVEDGRRRARELHDGVLQELSCIKSDAGALSSETGSAVRVKSSLDASDWALDEARAAVDVLGRDAGEPVGYVLHRSARDVVERHGARVVVDLADSVASPDGAARVVGGRLWPVPRERLDAAK